MEDLVMQVTGALCTGTGLAVGAMLLIAVLKQFLMIGRPNELLVFSGRQRQLADGSSIGYREVTGGGRAFRIPVLEKVDRMELSTLPVDIRITTGNGVTMPALTSTTCCCSSLRSSSWQRAITRKEGESLSMCSM